MSFVLKIRPSVDCICPFGCILAERLRMLLCVMTCLCIHQVRKCTQTGQQTGAAVWRRGVVALALSCDCRSAWAGAVVHLSAFTIVEVSISHHGTYRLCLPLLHGSLISTISGDREMLSPCCKPGGKPADLGSCCCWWWCTLGTGTSLPESW